jgi:hypothetical protein
VGYPVDQPSLAHAGLADDHYGLSARVLQDFSESIQFRLPPYEYPLFIHSRDLAWGRQL